MKKTLISFALAVALGVPTVGAIAAGTHHHAMKAAKSKTVSAVCPVMGTKIPDVKKAAGKSTYRGKTYYFCCGGCKPKFDKDPKKYAK